MQELVINVKKSVSMIVRGRFKSKTALLVVHVDGETLEQVFVFKYLGYHFIDQLSLAKSADMQSQKVSACYFSVLQKLADLRSDCPLKVAEQMFQATVASVADYGSEIYGVSKSVDQFQIRFFRQLLGLRRSTPVDTMYILVGYLPLHFRHIYLQLNFVAEILERPKDSLLRQALVTAVETAKKRKTAWFWNFLSPSMDS
ncbi:hypothetical protein BV898_09633 [Hypsibius exemplaris]|uniref:Uncharacterized protein n=1 Tax=Hypsibius exemplaris TaxID=2072580 RepID=A0A1W0WM99_HYPEX|nr:hypothetical protein BV898_09633 [Hypsibius exemplaris]